MKPFKGKVTDIGATSQGRSATGTAEGMSMGGHMMKTFSSLANVPRHKV